MLVCVCVCALCGAQCELKKKKKKRNTSEREHGINERRREILLSIPFMYVVFFFVVCVFYATPSLSPPTSLFPT